MNLSAANVDVGATGVKLDPGVMENCTVAENFHGVSTQTKAVYVYASGSIIRNCVIWGNRNNGGIANWGVRSGQSYEATCTCTTPELSGAGNISTDPAFVNANGDDFHLGLSGAVDTADYFEWMDWVDDLDGNDRVQGGKPDMGCYEFTASALTCGVAVYATGKALIDRCVVTGSHEGKVNNNATFTPGNGAIYLAEAGGNCGMVRNTVVADSCLQGCGGIVVGKYGRVENCTVIGNVSTNAAATVAGVKILDASASVVNTVVFGNQWGEAASDVGGVAGNEVCFDHCLIGVNPQLRGKGKWVYRPTSSSPCLDAGRTLNWMTEALDLYGQPRVQGQGAVKKPDIGAAEYRPSGFRLWVK